MSSDNWEQIATKEEVEGQTRLSVIVDDTPAILVLLGETWFVVEDSCTHDGQPLTDGEISDGGIKCPRHGARFDIKTGAALCMPATQAIQVFEVDVREDGFYAQPYSEQALKDLQASQDQDDSQAEQEVAVKPPASNSSETSEEAEENSGDLVQSSPNETAMLDALKQVIDPELFVNIVDLGLIYDISRKEETDSEVILTMTLTSPSCPAGPQLISQAKSALEGLPGVDDAEIKMTMSPPWTPDMMTEEARDQLGIF